MLAGDGYEFASVFPSWDVLGELYLASFTGVLESTDALLVLGSSVVDAGYHNVMAAAGKILFQ